MEADHAVVHLCCGVRFSRAVPSYRGCAIRMVVTDMRVELSADEVRSLIEAVEYQSNVAAQNDPKYNAFVWGPLLSKLRSFVVRDRIAEAALAVVSYDWSDNDRDAVEAIDNLRRALKRDGFEAYE